MPFVPKQPEYSGPKGPHLALLTGEGWIGIPEGATLWLVEDGSNPNKILPLVLTKVRTGQLTFTMADKDGAATAYVFKLTSAKPLSLTALKRLQENRGQRAPTVQGVPTRRADDRGTE